MDNLGGRCIFWKHSTLKTFGNIFLWEMMHCWKNLCQQHHWQNSWWLWHHWSSVPVDREAEEGKLCAFTKLETSFNSLSTWSFKQASAAQFNNYQLTRMPYSSSSVCPLRHKKYGSALAPFRWWLSRMLGQQIPLRVPPLPADAGSINERYLLTQHSW